MKDMRLGTRSVRAIAKLMLGALLLVQAVHLAQACVVAVDRPAMAFAASDHCKTHSTQHEVPPNACLSQCLQGDQSSPAYEIALPPPANVVLLTLPAATDASSPSKLCAPEPIGNRDPPPVIRFCSLLL
jgi:hypothetical protein